MIERLVGGVNVKGIAWRVLTLLIVFLGLIGFAEFMGNFIIRGLYFIHLGAIVPAVAIVLWFADWVFVIGGIIWFYRKTKH